MQTGTYVWDAFISHASEDKATVAVPLARELRNYCMNVWLDKWILGIGDSLGGRIDEGISKSRFLVLILSPTFFSKEWARTEFDAIRDSTVSDRDKLIPIWHDISKEQVANYSPLVASLVALSTKDGIEKIAARIASKLGAQGRDLQVEVDATSYSVLDTRALAIAIQESEDIPGSYSRRRISVVFNDDADRVSHSTREEITEGIRLVVTCEPLTFGIRNSYLLATCISSFVNRYKDWVDNLAGYVRLDLWLQEDSSTNTGIYVTHDEILNICDIVGVESPNHLQLQGSFDMLDLGAEVLARKAIPQILFHWFRQRKSQDNEYFLSASRLLNLNSWRFGLG